MTFLCQTTPLLVEHLTLGAVCRMRRCSRDLKHLIDSSVEIARHFELKTCFLRLIAPTIEHPARHIQELLHNLRCEAPVNIVGPLQSKVHMQSSIGFRCVECGKVPLRRMRVQGLRCCVCVCDDCRRDQTGYRTVITFACLRLEYQARIATGSWVPRFIAFYRAPRVIFRDQLSPKMWWKRDVFAILNGAEGLN